MAAGLLQACGAPADTTDVQESELRGAPCGWRAARCCQEKFRPGRLRGLCLEEAARGRGPCARPEPGDGGGEPDASDAGTPGDAGNEGHQCPSLEGISALPDATFPGVRFNLTAAIEDNGATGPLAFNWELAAGSAGTLTTNAAASEATFVCTSTGTQTVELTVTSGDPAATCTSTGAVTIDCTSLCGNGTLDPGEACDPPDGVNCDVNCTIPNHCPTIVSVVASPPTIYDFGDSFVTANATDPDPGQNLTFAWSATGGTVRGNASPSVVVYECTSVGLQTVTVSVSDGTCTTTGSVQVACLASCGNNIVEPGEQCDPPHVGPSGLQCSPTCQRLTCGNGALDPGEQCDPPQAGVCGQTCQSILCGNGVLDPGEQCDPPQSGVCSSTCQNVPAPMCPGPSAGGHWAVSQSFPTTVVSVWAISPTDAWLTTAAFFGPISPALPSRVYHWDGVSWSPTLGGDQALRFNFVWASGPTDVWITGDHLRHWDGSTWTDRTPPQHDPSEQTELVRGTGPNDVWVTTNVPLAVRDYLWHWDGTSWTDRSPPDPAGGLPSWSDLWPASATDVWATGAIHIPRGGGAYQVGAPILQHWDGTNWSNVTVPGNPYLFSLWASSGQDIWAASADATGLHHFDGQTWTKVPLPTTGYTYKVWGTCATDVWATGDEGLHFDGASWWVDPAMHASYVISGTSADDVWITQTILVPPTCGCGPPTATSVLTHRSK